MDSTSETGSDGPKSDKKGPAFYLARALARAHKSDDAGDDAATFQDEKEKWLPIARRTLQILQRHGYSLTKSKD